MRKKEQKLWQVAQAAPDAIASLFSQYPTSVIQLLHNRNLTERDAVEQFLHPDYARDLHDPFLFRDMKKTVERIGQAIKHKEKIVVHGDYDADGVCASTVLVTALRQLGGQVDAYLPNREKEGYGLKTATVENFAERGTKLLLTADCGITGNEAIARGNDRGIDTIVVDHHHAPDVLPEAYAILNPVVPEETYPFKHLAAVGVAFKLVQALVSDKGLVLLGVEQNEVKGEVLEKWLLDVVAIATVTDMMPLVGENRVLVSYGLLVLNKTRRTGLKALIEAAGLEMGNTGMDSSNRKQLNAASIGFRLGPRINAAGRLEHANGAYDLLMSEQPAKAAMWAQALNEVNKKRQEITEQTVKDAQTQVQDTVDSTHIITAYDPEWHIGVLGLVAGRLLQRYGHPTMVMGDKNGTITGSGRSRNGFHLVDALDTMNELFTSYGGHAQACGFTLKEKKLYEEFIERLRTYAKNIFREQPIKEILSIDSELQVSDLTLEFYGILQKFEPFGQANPQPKFLLKNVTVLDVQTVGDGKHLKLLLGQNGSVARRAVGFGMGEVWFPHIQKNDKVDIVAELMLNEWQGKRELQLRLVDLRKPFS
ncbi:MAG: single-stranded-DNA-specific exonuclease RecJ [Parcubacteria group bacterium CG08_land_8_20_14_0_20_48_21]|nr:MAG: single-stranded-DNA-specific exonuclease RecJ [Parcubacteria group bacterium CG08_land_8_20_14_0_20_48_21]PIW79167.1 MAG: single-stranded-DNA-specific exonuclease RecJ [Parcubacteria group bacterium CG_4_8_14_3_um_filter_48_16]PIY77815.1 MAG: single-stranded-DNA-specific exonuclease RecJ [Parcubacteria group bacterium CG_4_10_14_0_8_um_filter_48_154]PIZ77972.1 MAG: single-stranded-DNA-specific exonuclease RecJ [bacterium CG_4_10_14_0_2_um_filter_48_144]PJC39842.1 MAG: single-stranded-DN